MLVDKMMTEAELCKADSKLQRDYIHGIISLDEWNFAKVVLQEQWSRVVKEKEILKRLKEKYG